MTNDDGIITAVLDKALREEKPAKRARELVPAPSMHTGRMRRGIALIAAGITLCLLISSLTVPAVARAIGEAPWLGDSYLKFLTGTGMDLAYQAGLINELNRSDTQDGVTLTVLAAYADAAQTVILYKLSSSEQGKIEALWESFSIMPEIHKPLRSGIVPGSGSMEFIPEEGAAYGIRSLDPPGWNPFGQKLTAEVEALGLSVTFPVQTIPSALNETVKADRSFAYEDMRFTIIEAVFSPSATQVIFQIEGADDPRANGARNYTWSLLAADGTELSSLGGSLSNGHGVLNFLPTHSDEVTLFFLGSDVLYLHEDTLPLAAGSSTLTPAGALTIGKVEGTASGTEITLVWSGEGLLKKPDLRLVDARGNLGHVVQAEMTEDGMKLSMEHGDLIGPVQVQIGAVLIGFPEEIEAARIRRGQ